MLSRRDGVSTPHQYEIEIAGRRFAARALDAPLYDPESMRMTG
jgi:hypothetical protein